MHQAILYLLTFLTLLCSCTKDTRKTFWIYTSIYKDVIALMEPQLQKKFPDINFQWFQSGSENVAARLNAELSTGKSLADLVLTSDPFWYLELKNAGKLLNYSSTNTTKLPDRFRDSNGAFSIVRIPVAVLAYNSNVLKNTAPPTTWEELKHTKWKGKLSMGSPLESGTSLAVIAQLAHRKGWEYFASLRKNDLLAAGGNSSVIQRMETGERPVGIVLLENILDAQKRGSPILPIYPTDGAILVPSPIAILSTTPQPELAKRVYDFFLEETMQETVIAGRMYSPLLSKKAPSGAIPFDVILKTAFPWNNQLLSTLYSKREAMKKKFSETVLN